jgi:hypothetical protein
MVGADLTLVDKRMSTVAAGFGLAFPPAPPIP